jgi:3-keto-L-gulonate-6-phosphate decarboxylase
LEGAAVELWMLAGLVVDGPDQLAHLLDQRPVLARYLALLVLAGPNPPTVGELAERLDSKPSPTTVANELRRLRHALGEDLLARLDPRSTVLTADKPVRLRLDPDSVDLGRVRQHHALARQLLPSQPDAAVNQVRAALSEWSTSEDVAAARTAYPLSDEYIRDRLEEERRSVRLTYGETLLCLGHIDEGEAEFSAARATRQELGEILARPSCSGLDVRNRHRILSCGRAGQPATNKPDADAPAANSARRTRALIDLLQDDVGSGFGYHAPAALVEHAQAFLSSPDRVFVLEGGLGLGKTSFCLYLPDHVPDGMACQLHIVPGFDPTRESLAATILRYAAFPSYAADTITDLERLLSTEPSEWLFIIDGISNIEEWHSLCRELERILFRIDSPRIKFFLTRRPLSSTCVSRYPLLSATLSRPTQEGDQPSWELAPWTDDEAKTTWDALPLPSCMPYRVFSSILQRLLQVPLYMRLIAQNLCGPPADMATVQSPYQMIEICVRAALNRVGADSNLAFAALRQLVSEQYDRSFRRTATHSVRSLISPGEEAALKAGLLVSREGINDRRIAFVHDAIPEFVFATSIVDGATSFSDFSPDAAHSLSVLTEAAATSALAASVLRLVLFGLYHRSPVLLRRLVLNPPHQSNVILTAAVDGSADLPDLLPPEHIARLIRYSAEEHDVALAERLLNSHVALRAPDLGHLLPHLLRSLGSDIWPSIRALVEMPTVMDSLMDGLLQDIDLRNPQEARLASHVLARALLRGRSLHHLADAIQTHSQWQVRAALPEALSRLGASGADMIAHCRAALFFDPDYKVRAAAATAAVPRLQEHLDYLSRMLSDPNWHVRGAALRALVEWTPATRSRALALLDTDTWRSAPLDTRIVWWEVVLLTDSALTFDSEEDEACARAVFRLLRTATATLSSTLETRLADFARRSPSWCLRREADRFKGPRPDVFGERSRDRAEVSTRFRRLRGRRTLQVALDSLDRRQAGDIAATLMEAGVSLLEVGDPLIKRYGASIIEQVKTAAPNTLIVSEMMSADWSRDQVELAAFYGADVVLLIGPASVLAVRAAVEAARRYGMALVIDVPHGRCSDMWVKSMEECGVDGFVLTGNIDIGTSGPFIGESAENLRRWTELPIGISGGFDLPDILTALDYDLDILIVGRGVVDAADPHSAALALMDQLAKAPSPWIETHL